MCSRTSLSQHRPCSTWNTPVIGLEHGATRLPLIGRRSPGARRSRRIRLAAPATLTGRTWPASSAAIGCPGRGERSCSATSPPTPEPHRRRCSRDSGCATRRHRRHCLLSQAPRRPLHPRRRARPQGSLGELISFRPGSHPPAEVSEKPGLRARRQSGALVEVNALTRRCLPLSYA